MYKCRKNEEITAFNRKLVEWQKFREIHQLFLMKVCILDAAALMRWWWEFLIWSILLEHFFQLDFGMRGFFFVSDHWRLLINKWWERKTCKRKSATARRKIPVAWSNVVSFTTWSYSAMHSSTLERETRASLNPRTLQLGNNWESSLGTVFENHPKCRIWIFEKMTIFDIFNQLLST